MVIINGSFQKVNIYFERNWDFYKIFSFTGCFFAANTETAESLPTSAVSCIIHHCNTAHVCIIYPIRLSVTAS